MADRIKTSAAFIFLCWLICLYPVPDVYAFRCGEEIISTGDSRAKVMIKCGPPTFKDRVASAKGTRAKDRYGPDKKQAASKGVERWSYNCGKDDFIYVLTFEGGAVTKIETDGRGRGASECLGR